MAMVAAARAKQAYEPPPRVEVLEVEVGKDDVVDKVELVQAGSPFTVGGASGGGPGGGDAPPPALFPEQASVVSPFPKGGDNLEEAGLLLAQVLLALKAAQGVLGPAGASVYNGVEGLIMGLGKGGAGGGCAAPPEPLDEQRRRVGRAFDNAVKECDRSARALQRQFHVVARAQEQHAKCAAAAASAADERDRLDVELRKLWGEGAEERMGIRMQELDQEMLAERQGALDDQAAAGEFAPVLGRDIGELWPEVDEDGRPGTRTPGAEQAELVEKEKREVDLLCGLVGDDEDMEDSGERAGKMRRQDEQEDSEQGLAVRDQAGDEWALEYKEVDDKGGGAGLVAKGMGGKTGGGAAAAGGGKVNATIRKTG